MLGAAAVEPRGALSTPSTSTLTSIILGEVGLLLIKTPTSTLLILLSTTERNNSLIGCATGTADVEADGAAVGLGHKRW